MLKLCCNNNGVKALNFIIYNFHNPLFYSTSSSTSIKKFPFLANYLVDYLGFSKQQARYTSAKFEQHHVVNKRKHEVSSSKFVSNFDLVVQFFRQNGFDVSQIRIVVSVQPRVLLCRVDKTLKPNIDHFLKIGFSKPDFFEVVSVNPYVLFNCHPQFVRATEALKDVMGNYEYVISIMKKSHWTSISGMSNNLISNVALLRSYGVSIDLIQLKNIWVFLCDSSRFLDGVHLMASFGEKNIESKIRMFENFGCMRSDVLALGRKNPMLLGLSEARIKRSLEYLMKELGFSPDYVMSHGALLSYSLEKRIIPRIRVLLALKEKGLIKKDHAPYTILNRSEPHFLNRYVLPFEEIREVYAKELAKLTDRSSMKPSNEGRAGDDKP
uniref:Uncharacterized protein n=1 Tax=Chenopodium quinoa TaxID=63459 RepID=A0A803MHY5_CHEQI